MSAPQARLLSSAFPITIMLAMITPAASAVGDNPEGAVEAIVECNIECTAQYLATVATECPGVILDYDIDADGNRIAIVGNPTPAGGLRLFYNLDVVTNQGVSASQWAHAVGVYSPVTGEFLYKGVTKKTEDCGHIGVVPPGAIGWGVYAGYASITLSASCTVGAELQVGWPDNHIRAWVECTAGVEITLNVAMDMASVIPPRSVIMLLEDWLCYPDVLGCYDVSDRYHCETIRYGYFVPAHARFTFAAPSVSSRVAMPLETSFMLDSSYQHEGFYIVFAEGSFAPEVWQEDNKHDGLQCEDWENTHDVYHFADSRVV